MPGNVNVKPFLCFQPKEGEAWPLRLATDAGYPQWQRKWQLAKGGGCCSIVRELTATVYKEMASVPIGPALQSQQHLCG